MKDEQQMRCISCDRVITQYQTVLDAHGARLHIYEIDDKAELCESCHDNMSVCDWCGIAVDENVPMIDVHGGSRICPFCAKGEDRSGRILGGDIEPEFYCPACNSRFFTPAKLATPCCGAEYEISEDDYEICSRCKQAFEWDMIVPVCPACANDGSKAYIQPDYEGCFQEDEKTDAVIFVDRGQCNNSNLSQGG